MYTNGMFALGVLAVLQMIYLPGWLATRLWQPDDARRNPLDPIPLSLLINFYFVYVLTAVHAYNRISVLVLLACEAALAVYVLRRKGPGEARHTRDDSSVPFASTWIAASMVVGAFAAIALASLGTRFIETDELVSWNAWAVEWAGNRLPTTIHEYPQLLPANWSLTYQITGDTTVHFFAKAAVPFFAAFMLARMVLLARTLRSSGIAIGTVIGGFVLYRFFGVQYVSSGMTDLPVACLSLMAIAAALESSVESTDTRRNERILTGALIVAAAALCKQTGLYVAAVYPLLCWLLVPADAAYRRSPLTGTGTLRSFNVVTVYGVLGALLAPWYLYHLSTFFHGNAGHSSLIITKIHREHTVIGRLLRGFELTAQNLSPSQVTLGYVLLVLLALLLVASLSDRRARVVGLLISIPYYLIWAVLFSTDDMRNINIALGAICINCGIGADVLFARLPQRARDRRTLTIVIVATIMIGGTIAFPRRWLVERQRDQRFTVVNPPVDAELLSYLRPHANGGKILNSYIGLEYMPDFEGRLIPFEAMILEAEKSDPAWLQRDFSAYERGIAAPEVGYVLLYSIFDRDYSPLVMQDVRTRIADGRLSVVLEGTESLLHSRFMLLQVTKR